MDINDTAHESQLARYLDFLALHPQLHSHTEAAENPRWVAALWAELTYELNSMNIVGCWQHSTESWREMLNQWASSVRCKSHAIQQSISRQSKHPAADRRIPAAEYMVLSDLEERLLALRHDEDGGGGNGVKPPPLQLLLVAENDINEVQIKEEAATAAEFADQDIKIEVDDDPLRDWTGRHLGEILELEDDRSDSQPTTAEALGDEDRAISPAGGGGGAASSEHIPRQRRPRGRVVVSHASQKQRFVDYLERHPQLMHRAVSASAAAADDDSACWQSLTDDLNAMGFVQCTADRWHNAFSTWMINVRSKQRAIEKNKPPQGAGGLSDLEKRLVALPAFDDRPARRKHAWKPPQFLTQPNQQQRFVDYLERHPQLMSWSTAEGAVDRTWQSLTAEVNAMATSYAGRSADQWHRTFGKWTRIVRERERRVREEIGFGELNELDARLMALQPDRRAPLAEAARSKPSLLTSPQPRPASDAGSRRCSTTTNSVRLRGLFDERLRGFAAEFERRLAESDMLRDSAPNLCDQQFGRLMACVHDALEQQIEELCERLIEDVRQRFAADPEEEDGGQTAAAAAAMDDEVPEITPTPVVKQRRRRKKEPEKPRKRERLSLECDYCHEIFAQKSTLKEHMLRHLGIKNYICEYCSRPFRHPASFRTHLRMHRNQLEFVCDQCPAAFNNTARLRKHQEIHTGQKPYKCPRCPRAERDRSSIVRHLHRDHGVALADMDEVFPRKLGYWGARQKRSKAGGAAGGGPMASEPEIRTSSDPDVINTGDFAA